MARRRPARDPFTQDERDPLELIAKLLVGSSYRVPVEGTGTKAGLQAVDVAGALGYMNATEDGARRKDRLEGDLALAVATRANHVAIARLSLDAYRQAARNVRWMRPRPLELSQPADRWRLRMIIYAAASELVWPEHRKPYKDLAVETKMRLATYVRVHKSVTATLQESLNNGRRDFARRLWGRQ